MVSEVVGTYESPLGSEDAGYLVEAALKIGQVVQHPVTRHEIELSISEGELLDVCLQRFEPLSASSLDRRCGLINANDFGRSE
jgi:hypothetical protein